VNENETVIAERDYHRLGPTDCDHQSHWI